MWLGDVNVYDVFIVIESMLIRSGQIVRQYERRIVYCTPSSTLWCQVTVFTLNATPLLIFRKFFCFFFPTTFQIDASRACENWFEIALCAVIFVQWIISRYNSMFSGAIKNRVSDKSGKSQGILLFLEKWNNLDKNSGKTLGNIFENRYCWKVSKYQ